MTKFRIDFRTGHPEVTSRDGDMLAFGDNGVFVHHVGNTSDFYPYAAIFRIEKGAPSA